MRALYTSQSDRIWKEAAAAQKLHMDWDTGLSASGNYIAMYTLYRQTKDVAWRSELLQLLRSTQTITEAQCSQPRHAIWRALKQLVLHAPIQKLPDNITVVPDRVFFGKACLQLKSLPSGLRRIGTFAFANCVELRLDGANAMPDSVENVHESAFAGCTSLMLPALSTKLEYIAPGTFVNCANLALTELPASVRGIGQEAFRGCGKLALSALPAALLYIRPAAFKDCKELRVQTLPPAIRTNTGEALGKDAFAGCLKSTLSGGMPIV